MGGSPCMAWETKGVKSWILSWKRGRISFLGFRILFMDFCCQSLYKVCTTKDNTNVVKTKLNILAPGGIKINAGNWRSDRSHQGPYSALLLWLAFVMVPRRGFIFAASTPSCRGVYAQLQRFNFRLMYPRLSTEGSFPHSVSSRMNALFTPDGFDSPTCSHSEFMSVLFRGRIKF